MCAAGADMLNTSTGTPDTPMAGAIPRLTHMLFQGMFAVITPALSSTKMARPKAMRYGTNQATEWWATNLSSQAMLAKATIPASFPPTIGSSSGRDSSAAVSGTHANWYQ